MTKKKAKKILRHGSIRGEQLSTKQKGMFGAIAGGNYKGPVDKPIFSGGD